MMELTYLLRHTLLFGSIGVLAACSSADSTSTTPNTAATPTAVTISGSIFASSVSGAEVTVKDSAGNTVAGPVTTSADGSYSIDLTDTDLTSDLMFDSTGGSFIDEETGTGTTAGAMSAYIASGTLADGDSVHVTPGTTITSILVSEYGKTVTEAQTAFFNAFAYMPDSTVEPVDPTDPASLNADDASKHVGWRAAVFSKLAQTLTLQAAEQFDLFDALAQDLSHGELDGMDASGAVGIGNTGKQLPADILDQYITATASYTTVETANLKITYSPPMMNVHGKNQFKLIIEDTSGGAPAPATGLTDLEVMPIMYMADRNHATPVGEIAESAIPGEYDVTIYYLMPSRMMDGTTMGTWDLKVMTGMKSVHFYPNIEMAMMNNTARVQLKGINDLIIDMNGLPVPRPYNLFRDSLTQQGSGSTYDFDIFIAPMENMMSFPALIDGMTLTSGMGGTAYVVSGITVEASVDDGSTWNTGSTGVTDGVWSFNALNLNSGANEVRVRLTVSGETKTDGGLATDPDYQTFTVTLP
jgi:hypothetical protein